MSGQGASDDAAFDVPTPDPTRSPTTRRPTPDPTAGATSRPSVAPASPSPTNVPSAGPVAATYLPTASPLAHLGTCPEAYGYLSAYRLGDRVASRGRVYRCVRASCKSYGLAPGRNWKVVGSCSDPTSSVRTHGIALGAGDFRRHTVGAFLVWRSRPLVACFAPSSNPRPRRVPALRASPPRTAGSLGRPNHPRDPRETMTSSSRLETPRSFFDPRISFDGNDGSNRREGGGRRRAARAK